MPRSLASVSRMTGRPLNGSHGHPSRDTVTSAQGTLNGGWPGRNGGTTEKCRWEAPAVKRVPLRYQLMRMMRKPHRSRRPSRTGLLG